MLRELLQQDGFSLARKTAKEMTSACPSCGGNDRFIIFLEGGSSYWCRQCRITGDAIQYLRDFRGLSFQEAAELVGKSIDPRPPINTPVKAKPKPQNTIWVKRAADLVKYAHGNLLSLPEQLAWLKSERGITKETAVKFRLGYISQTFFCEPSEFGLVGEKKVIIPKGLVIPWKNSRVRFRCEQPVKDNRYLCLTGSKATDLMTIGTTQNVTGVVVESELDAILLDQETTRPLFILALGSVNMMPNQQLSARLNHCPLIMVALDTDSAGTAWSCKWLKTFGNAIRTPIPKRYGKDITDLWKSGVDLNVWMSVALEYHAEHMSR